MQKIRKQNTGFTLIELLVVIAIIALLVSILLPSLNAAKELAKTVVCLNNLKGCGMSMLMYAHENDGEVYLYTTWASGNSDSSITWAGQLQDVGMLDNDLNIAVCPSQAPNKYDSEDSSSLYQIYGAYVSWNNQDAPMITVVLDSVRKYYRNIYSMSYPAKQPLLLDSYWSTTQTQYFVAYTYSSTMPSVQIRHQGAAHGLLSDGHVEAFREENMADYYLDGGFDENGNWQVYE